eukprot:TRINITY_DN100474_c0_g1_i1.p1 TRINITY_DN100474_c0_g1~~TRINITY_DN100474_c0_g1_i1.p1  ORF type:complete len:232 (-),score=50.21 TRINITY_DN100474_c0_g1_i1:112-807(-)
MLIPVGGPNAGLPDAEPPVAVKETYSCWWWTLFVFFVSVGVARFVAEDPFGGLLTLLMAYIVYHMVQANCAKMSQYCVFMFGTMCIMNAMFESIAMFAALGGRSSQTQQATTSAENPNVTVYTLKVEKHPFFDQKLGFVYNLQSALMIASPVSLLFGTLLAYYTYHAFPSSLFEQDDAAPDPFLLGGSGPARQGGHPGYGSNRGYGTRPSQTTSEGAVPKLFEGQGQRLGA